MALTLERRLAADGWLAGQRLASARRAHRDGCLPELRLSWNTSPCRMRREKTPRIQGSEVGDARPPESPQWGVGGNVFLGGGSQLFHNGWMDGWMDKLGNGWMVGWIMDGWMVGWIKEGWEDGWIEFNGTPIPNEAF